MSVFVIADDLTGAADTGLPFARRGRSVRVFLNGFVDGTAADVCVMSTETRQRSRDEAESVARDLPRRLGSLGAAPLLFKKIDSTLRGWVGAELRALLDALPNHTAWVVPSYPKQGRQMRGGVYTVDGRPLRETGFARDVPGCPEDSSVPALLERQMEQPVGFVGEAALARGPEAICEQARRQGQSVLVFDAATDTHLRQIALAGEGMHLPILWVGSAGLAGALAERLGGPETAPLPPLPADKAPVVVVAGSANPVTRRQIACLKERVPVCHQVLTGGPVRAGGDTPCLLTLPERRLPLPETEAAALLGRAAAAWIRRTGSRRFLLTGGDTAAATLRHLDAVSLEVVGAVEEGMPLLRVVGGAADGALAVTKAGGFGAPASLCRAFDVLAGQGRET